MRQGDLGAARRVLGDALQFATFVDAGIVWDRDRGNRKVSLSDVRVTPGIGPLRWAGTETSPVQYVTIEGSRLIVNTRSALALMRAGVPRDSWRLIDATATDAAAIEARLIKNGLTSEGTDVLRITGAGHDTSTFR